MSTTTLRSVESPSGFQAQLNDAQSLPKRGHPHWLLVAGLVLSTATQLRFSGGFGIGETFTLLYVGLRLLDVARGVMPAATPQSRPVALFWVTIAVSMGIGLLWADVAGAAAGPDAFLEGVKITIVGLVVLCLMRFEGSRQGGIRQVWDWVAIGMVVVFSVLRLAVFVTDTVGPLTLGYSGSSRFLGWSTNPNQVAIFFTAAPFLFLASQRKRPLYAVFAVASLVVGWSTGSDGFALAMACGGATVAFVGFGHSLGDVTPRRILSALSGCVFAVLAVLLATRLVTRRVDLALADGGGGASGRGDLWRAAWRQGFESPIFGHGPGAGIAVAGESGLQEAHNTVLDLLLRGGIVAVVAFVLLHLVVLRAAVKKGPFDAGAVIALFTMGMTSFVFRHPTYWLALLCAGAACVPFRSKGDPVATA